MVYYSADEKDARRDLYRDPLRVKWFHALLKMSRGSLKLHAKFTPHDYQLEQHHVILHAHLHDLKQP